MEFISYYVAGTLLFILGTCGYWVVSSRLSDPTHNYLPESNQAAK